MNGTDRVRFLDLHAVHQALRPELDRAWARVIDSGRYVLGPEVEQFEQAFAEFCGCAHAIGVGNGLDALELALRAAGVGAGDEVIVPAHTFVATWLAVSLVGATPVAVEPAAGGFNVDAAGVIAARTARTRAVIVVHLYGEPVACDQLRPYCDAEGLTLIEDAAQAHGARRQQLRVGAMGHLAAFSFYPGKNLGALGDGGAVTTQDAELAERLRRLRNYGALHKYDHTLAGRNSRLDPLQAALLGVKLRRLSEWNRQRQALAALYHAQLRGLDALQLPQSLPGNEAVWHLYVVRHPQRDALAAHLDRCGVDCMIHYPRPVYRLPAFAAFAPQAPAPSDDLAASVLSLPMGPHLDAADVQRVSDAVRSFCQAAA